MNYADKMNAPRIDPFTAEAEAMPATSDDSEFEALRLGIAVMSAERDMYYSETVRLRDQLRELRDFLQSVGTVRNL